MNSSAAEGRRSLAPPPRMRRPLSTRVEPVKVLVAAKVREPAPVLTSPPMPTPAAPPIGLAKVRSFEVTSSVPPADRKVRLR